MGRTSGFMIGAGAALAACATFTLWQTRRAKHDNPPLGRFIDVEGVRLHYFEEGAGEPLILIHGNGSMIQDFLTSGLVRLAARRRRVIVFDRPGYGWSSRPRGRRWTPAKQADLLATAARELGAERAHLFGHSWGALIAAEWALRHPQSVTSLTLASGYYFPTARLDVVLVSVPALPLIGDLMRFTVTPVAGRLLWPLLLRKVFGPSPVPRHFEDFPKGIALSPPALRASAEESAMMIPSARKLRDRYGELKMPVTIIAGDGDRIVNTGEQADRLHRAIPGSRLWVLPGVGHMVHHADPQGIGSQVGSSR